MTLNRATLLIIDDDEHILDVLEGRFCNSGYRVIRASNGEDALSVIRNHKVDLAISDIKMPQMSGIELFSRIQSLQPGLPVIFLTAYGSIDEAVSAVKNGAFDYMTKPFEGKELQKKVAEILSNSEYSSDTPPARETLVENNFVWGSSPAMAHIRDIVSRVSKSSINTLILGESGVGKECIAKAIHDNSPRKDGPYIVIDCGSTPPGILESELFGHVKGAFTNAVNDKKGLIEAADGGTLFLDEIGNISSDMQHRLLRFLEDRKIRRVGAVDEKPIDCRVIAATNANLTADIEEGKFRQDLYFRLKVVTIEMPPLRQRKEDIPKLINYFINKLSQTHGIADITIPQETIEWMKTYNWPGNVRELRNGLEGALILCKNNTLQISDLQLQGSDTPAVYNNKKSSTSEPFTLEHSEREAIIRALKQAGGVQTSAAELLNISRRSIQYKLKKHNIHPSEYK